MKKILLLILGAIAVLGVVCGCQKVKTSQTPLSVSVRTKSGSPVASIAGQKAVTIDATASWTATPESDWISVSPDRGEKGVNEVILTYTANATGAQRVGTVRFTSGSHSETFTLKQDK